MARKKGNELDTRGALLDAAWELFQLQGYEGASVEAIARRAGLSKGTFFHYFATKNDLLEAVCEYVSAPAWAALSSEVADRSLPAVSRLNRLLSGMRQWRLFHIGALVDLYRALARDENALLRAKLMARQDELFRGALLDVLVHGNREGAFSVADVEETARMVCAVARCAGESNLRELAAAGSGGGPAVLASLASLASLARRAEAGACAIERLLGARPGSLERAGRAELRRAKDAARASRPVRGQERLPGARSRNGRVRHDR